MSSGLAPCLTTFDFTDYRVRKRIINWSVIVVQLVEWSLPIPEVHSLIQSSAKFYNEDI